MRRQPHENVATVLVAPGILADLELQAMALDLRLWPVETAPNCVDGPRTAHQIRRQLLIRHRGEWDCAADWTAAWMSFGPTWRTGDEPLPWSAHAALWGLLDAHAPWVRFHRRLGGVFPLYAPTAGGVA